MVIFLSIYKGGYTTTTYDLRSDALLYIVALRFSSGSLNVAGAAYLV
jgi:hypothetical protein